ncbi:hypothetical protein [Dactylosporangium sp. NPDC048998]|uniref:hypothetical protein n=1 Tax=Dactylosporangium sp. NPDC048998 TaxID=3363976 RepID=UPI003720C1E4
MATMAAPWRRALRPGWLFAVVLLTAVVLLGVRLLHGVQVHQREYPGMFTVEACTFTPAQKGYYAVDCTGAFRSDDGSLTATGVTVSFVRSSDIELTPYAGRQWRAWLAGPDDRSADLDVDAMNRWALPLAGMVILVACLVAHAMWMARRSRRQASTG